MIKFLDLDLEFELKDFSLPFTITEEIAEKLLSLKNDNGNLDMRDHTKELLKSMNKKEFYLSSFGEDEEGELYIINYSGQVYSITK